MSSLRSGFSSSLSVIPVPSIHSPFLLLGLLICRDLEVEVLRSPRCRRLKAERASRDGHSAYLHECIASATLGQAGAVSREVEELTPYLRFSMLPRLRSAEPPAALKDCT